MMMMSSPLNNTKALIASDGHHTKFATVALRKLLNDPTIYFGVYNDDENFGSPLPFDSSENGLWNGKFVPPPPRPPFLDEAVIADGLTTCDLCSWASPTTKSTFIFDGTIEKATELGWPFMLILVSVLSAIIGALLITVFVKCRRRNTAKRNETYVHWRSKNKRAGQILKNNVYSPHPTDSIRGLPGNNDGCNWSNVTTIVVNR